MNWNSSEDLVVGTSRVGRHQAGTDAKSRLRSRARLPLQVTPLNAASTGSGTSADSGIGKALCSNTEGGRESQLLDRSATPALRFFGMLHIGAMFAAVGLLQQGHRATLRATTERARCQRPAVTTLLALEVICAAIPWPVFEYGRPLLRSDG